MGELAYIQKEIELRQNLAGENFTLPPAVGAKVFILGELTCAKDFTQDNVYVTLETRLTQGWHWNPEDYEDPRATETDESDLINRGRSITQLSRAVPYGDERKPVSHFSFPVAWNLIVSEAALSKTWPQVLVQVNSCDSWGRHRIEGYGFLPLPSTPGYHEVSVRTYKPLENLYSEVHSYFLGGSVRIEEPWKMMETSSLDEEGQKTNINRFGLATMSSGKVLFSLSMAKQDHNSMDRARKKTKELNGKQKKELAWRQKEKKAQYVLNQTLSGSMMPPPSSTVPSFSSAQPFSGSLLPLSGPSLPSIREEPPSFR